MKWLDMVRQQVKGYVAEEEPVKESSESGDTFQFDPSKPWTLAMEEISIHVRKLVSDLLDQGAGEEALALILAGCASDLYSLKHKKKKKKDPSLTLHTVRNG